ncbi:FecR domain-containing protein [Pseudoxanthomonas sp. Root630]|uniref:FecR family protein n=1 Tax=Pseudoxanthomonas sp. Root630 TaxID=1736574 RepID=UPI00138EC95A|nr:FecR domain-containing protein [Pseudoxanthomonas sp. Root630]
MSEEGRETSRAIEEAAAQWVARLDRAPLTTAEDRQLHDWLRGDPRRRGAFMRARALWLRPDLIAAADARPTQHRAQPSPVPAGSRRAARTRPRTRSARLRQWLGALAASLLLVVFVLVTVPVPTAYATAKGEMRRIPLTGGSTLTLNTDSRVDVYEETDHVRVKVRRGEVLVEAVGGERPLTVEIDGRHLEAGAATFVVRKLQGTRTQVVVQNGTVNLPARSVGQGPLLANTRASLGRAVADVDVATLSAEQMQRELAWREGKLAFRGETLADAAAEFARYNDASIEIADPQLAKAPITGLFAANNPAGFSRAVAGVFGARVRHEARGKIVIED